MENRYLRFEQVTRLNIDINSACNSACPGCARTAGLFHKSKVFPDNKHMSLDVWKKLFDEVGHQINTIVFCGNYGDAGATHDLPEMIAHSHSVNPNTRFIVVSNMGLNSEDYWRRLGNSAPREVLLTQASIDGLSDTNGIYRRFVKWDKVMRNVRALRETNAHMTWKYIEFPWNSHQIEEARTLANEIGFDDFVVTNNNNPNWEQKVYDYYKNNDWNNVNLYLNDPIQHRLQAEDVIPMQALKLERERQPEYDSISCYTKDEQSVHIDWEGNVWPCCWWGTADYHPSPFIASAMRMFKPINPNWNNLHHHTLRDILETEFYRLELMNSLETEPAPTCVSSCGKCDGKWNSVNTIGKAS